MSSRSTSDGGELGWALIGCGGAGRGHARGAEGAAGVSVRAFYDPVPGKAGEYAGEFGGVAAEDPDQIFGDSAIDIVSIATPHNTHTELAIAAFAAGKHVYLEKPMAMTTDECVQIAEAQKAAGKQLMINYSFRFSGAVRAAKQRLGPPIASHAQCMMARADLSLWRWDPTIGGGPMWDVGIHAVDLLCLFHGAPPVEVTATGGQASHPDELAGTDVLDTIAATLRFGDGSVATLLISDADFNAFVSKWLFEIYGRGESAVIYDHARAVAFSKPGGGKTVETLSPPPADRFPFLLDAIRNGGESYVPAATGIVATSVVESIIASVHTGRTQTVDPRA
jgi:myo-inositol 2-dehydrogenase/D-chiro-inositol 1-dehydrogenase